MNNFKDHFHMLPNVADNFYRMKQQAIQEALLQEAKKKKSHKKEDKKEDKKADKKADKDYDGDGEVESGSEEYLGSRSNAIKKAIAKKKGKKVNEDVAWTDDYLPGNKKMSGIGVKELQKILAGGGAPVLGSGKNASPEIIAAAKMHLDAVTRGPSSEQAKSAYQFFRQNFPHMGVEDEIGVMHGIAGHTPVKQNDDFPRTENEMKRR
jgi:hypothetical protein